MARKKYNWEKIKADYEIGLSNAEIHKKHDVSYQALRLKIKRDEWKVCSQTKDAISAFKDGCSQVVNVASEQGEQVQEAIDEKLQHDLKVLAKERKLDIGGLDILMGVASLTTKNIREAIEEKKNLKPHELKAYADIGEKVRGKASKPTTQVNVQQNNTTTIMTQEEKREKFKKRKLEILGS